MLLLRSLRCGPLIEAKDKALQKGGSCVEHRGTSVRAFLDEKFRNLKHLRVILDDYPNDPRYLDRWAFYYNKMNLEINLVQASFLFSQLHGLLDICVP